MNIDNLFLNEFTIDTGNKTMCKIQVLLGPIGKKDLILWDCWTPRKENFKRKKTRIKYVKSIEVGALGRPRGMVQGGRREGGSGWRTRVYLWWMHFDIWQN